MIDEHILQIKENFGVDESIRRCEYHEYLPITGSSLNTSGEIRIILESQDEFFYPANSLLIFNGQVCKNVAANTAYADADKITLINNFPMYLFNNIRYELSGHEIESINNPGPATTMKGLLKYSYNFEKGQGMNQCWTKDTPGDTDDSKNDGFKTRHDYIIETPTPKGQFSFAIPFKHIFGFAEDYDKVLYGLRHVLTLVRQSDNDSIFRASTTDVGKILLSKISWYMPRILPNDQERLSLVKTIEEKVVISAGFRMHQCDTISVPQSTTFSWRMSVRTSPESPRWVIVGFQTNRVGNQEKNPAAFDHCNAEDVWVELNGNPYPSLKRKTNFTKQEIATIYNAISDFLPSYYGIENVQPNISPIHFKDLYPLHVINISKQPERLKYGVMDMNLRATFSETVPENTQVYALVISDRILKFQSDGRKLNVIL